MSVVEIPLHTPPGYSPHVALIDVEDAETVGAYQWRFLPERYGQTGGYAVARQNERLYMHRLVLGLEKGGLVVDHINRDGLDNRRSNLRAIPRGANAQNATVRIDSSTGHRGVQAFHRRGRTVYRVCVSTAGIRRTKVLHDLDAAIALATQWRRELMPYATT